MSLLKKLFYLFFPVAIGGIVAFIIKDSMDYSSLNQPLLSPPGILFPIVWTILYLIMGISYYIYKKDINTNDKIIDIVYYSQLFINALWSIIFFNFKLYFLSILWIILLDALVYYLIILFLGVKRTSAYLNIPYMIWILFATYLTVGIYMLN